MIVQIISKFVHVWWLLLSNCFDAVALVNVALVQHTEARLCVDANTCIGSTPGVPFPRTPSSSIVKQIDL